MNKKILAVGLACTTLATTLVGCSGGENKGAVAKGDKIEIRLLTRMVGTSPQVQIYNEVIEEFKAKYPEVVIVDDSQGDDSSYNNILKTDISSGTMPNIFRIQGVANLGKYIDEGLILDVEPFMEEDSEWGGGFTEGAVNYYRVPGYEGVYGVPCESGLIGIYYNERIFKEAGFDTFPETWKEFTDAIEKIDSLGYTPIGLGAKTSYMGGHLHNLISYRWLGTDAAKKLGTRELSWTDPEVVETLGFVKELHDIGAFPDGVAGISDDIVKADFQNGDAAMFITGPWAIPSFTDPAQCPEADNIKFAKFPYFEEKPEFKDEDMQVISPYMINGKLEGRELELTMELVKMLTSKETAERFAYESSQLLPRSDMNIDQSKVSSIFADVLNLGSNSTGIAVDIFDYDPIPSMIDRTRNSIVSLFTGATPEEAAKEIQAEIDNAK
ncbi:MAG: ABC transporter substrate-binding protein [Cellulosilyticaceae bacterium]